MTRDAPLVPRTLLVVLLLTAMLGGCTAIGTQEEPDGAEQKSGLLRNTANTKLPPGLESAYIYEIDGAAVNYLRETIHLSPGEHRLRVWPVDNAPRSNQIVPDPVRIAMENIEVLELTVEIRPGYRYVFAARTNISRTRSVIGADSHRFPDNRYVMPVLVREVAPADYIEGAKGLGLMGLTMALPALIAPAAF